MNPKKPILTDELKLVNILQSLVIDEATISNILSVDQVISNIKAKAISVKESKLSKITCNEIEIRDLSLDDVFLINSDLSAIRLPNLSAQRVEVKSNRLSGAQIYEATLKDVLFKDCKLDLSNFRFSKLKNVVFEDCMLTEADFAGATFDNVCFKACTLEEADFSNVKVKKLDLQTSNILGINGISSLKGAIITPTQLIGIAPQLASEIGLVISNDN